MYVCIYVYKIIKYVNIIQMQRMYDKCRCTINSKDCCCRESRHTALLKPTIYTSCYIKIYDHSYRILVILVKNKFFFFTLENATSHRNLVENKIWRFLHFIRSERFFAIRRSRLFFSLFLFHLKSNR